MRFGCASLATLAACYSATANPGAPCGPNDECPSNLECRDNVCVLPGGETADASVDGAIDAMTAPWKTPTQLVTGVSSESDPSMTQNRLTIVFMSEADDNLYVATRSNPKDMLTVIPLAPLNSGSREKSPEISPDGSTVYFTSNRSGDFDVYVSTFGTIWSLPMLVDELSTAGDDVDIAVSPDGLTAVVIDAEATNRFLIHTRATASEAFGDGEHHAELSITDDATAPTITNGGAIVYFHAGVDRDLYRATRKPDGTYTVPVAVDELNTPGRDAAPFVLQNDTHIIFERAGDLYEASRP
jgi:dipeptidyl aminopeptidase/acylaminoacyl peptidase